MKKSLTAALVVLLVTTGFTHGSAERSNTTGPEPATATTETALTVLVSGPCCISEIGNYIYVANTFGASGSVSYQWWHQFPGSPPSFLGTGQTQMLFVNDAWDVGVNVCVEATDGVDQDQDCMLVTWTGQ